MKLTTRTMELTGTSYEIGKKLGQFTAAIPPLKAHFTAGMQGFDEQEVKKATEVFANWCPGLNEELQGFADALEVELQQVVYYGMTYLRPRPRCSQIALLPTKTTGGHPLLARNYEFNHEAEDFALVKTSVAGKYTHMGTSVLHFGRDDGFNEHGLAVSMSSCGFPVGPMPYMRAPKLEGLQFWAVIRTLLENCKNVEEALAYIEGMPIAYNLNMMLVDKSGHVALVETLDGRTAVKQLDISDEKGYLHATNHPVLPELIPYEPKALRHSMIRYDWIREEMDKAGELSVNDLKNMLHAKFPNGLCCHYFKDFFGTTKSMVIDPYNGTVDLCWGGNPANGWHQYNINAPLADATADIEIEFEPFDPKMGQYLPLTAE